MYQQRIREIYGQLSPGYRRIADFLLNNYQEAAFMTAAQVGKAAEVDTTLVVRFAQRLGYPGFPELIDDIQADVKRDLRAVYEPGPEDATPAGLLQRMLIQDRNNLEYMLLHTDAPLLQRVVELIDAAPHVFLAGEGNAMYLAEAFAMRLLVLGICAHTVSSEPAGQAAIAAGIGPDDLFIGIGTTPLGVSVAAILKLAREAGARTVAIVGSATNPVASVAEHVIVAPVRTVGIMPSWTALAAVLHGLGQATAMRRGDRAAKWVMRTDRLLQAYVEELQAGIPTMREVMAAYNAGEKPGPAS